MSTPTTDYNQQMLAYLQTWRELLEQWTTMAAGLLFPTAPSAMPAMPSGTPFIPPMLPTAPFMPPMPPTAPAPPMPPTPTDYTQQLFSYLQAWRQYLEQMSGARPGPPQPPTTQPASPSGNYTPNESGSESRPERPPHGLIRAVNEGGSMMPMPLINEWGSIRHPGFTPASSTAQIYNRGPEGPQVLRPPVYEFGNVDRVRMRPDTAGLAVSSAPPEASRYASEAPAQRPVGSPFLSAMGRVGPTASPQFAPRSLFSTPGAQTAARFREAGQTPSP